MLYGALRRTKLQEMCWGTRNSRAGNAWSAVPWPGFDIAGALAIRDANLINYHRGNIMQSRGLYFAVLGVLGFAASNAWADNIYLKVPGVTGPVTQAPYTGDIEVLSYSQGFSNPNNSQPQCSDTALMKLIDVTSSYFARSVLDQSAPFTATIYFANPSTFVADTTIKMTGVTVTSVQHSGSEGSSSPLAESITMHATSLTVTFTSNGVSKSYTTSCP
jgi:type VI protein secretion system component Hcp